MRWILLFLLFTFTAHAQNLTLVVGASAGGGYDIAARLLARHMTSSVVVKNMPGAGGVKAATWLYEQAPRDGSVIATFPPSTITRMLLRSLPYDPSKLSWVGSISSMSDDAFFLVASKRSGFRSIADLHGKRSMVIAGIGTSEGVVIPLLLRHALGLNLKIISGYTSGPRSILAIERGEADGRMISYSGMRTLAPQWLKESALLLDFSGRHRFPAFPNVPTALELAKTSNERAAISFFQTPFELWRPYAGPPGVPEKKLNALRREFQLVVHSPKFKSEAERIGVDVTPLNAVEASNLVDALIKTDPTVLNAVKAALLP